MKKHLLYLACFLLAFSSCSWAERFSDRVEVKSFIKEAAKKYKLDKTKLEALFQTYESSAEVLQKIAQPFERLPWDKYQKALITTKRINDGVAFWDQYQDTLQQAEKRFKVPPEIVTAIIGIESSYGRQKGQYPVFQALATLAFDYEPRSKFFLNELEKFLILTHYYNLDPFKMYGSYAGAMGSPQFMPSSYLDYAIDFAQTGQLDIINNMINAIGSVANYLSEHKWEGNQPVVHLATTKNNFKKDKIQIKQQIRKPHFKIQQLNQLGIIAQDQQLSLKDVPLSLIELETEKGPQYWLGRKNFYVITRYNHSTNYAMAIWQLSQEIKQARDKQLELAQEKTSTS